MFGKRQINLKMPGVRLPRPVRNALISAGILLVLFVVAGVVYTFIMGRQTPQQPIAQPVAVQQPSPVVKPRQPPANAPESAAVQMLTSPVSAGDAASISVRTNPTSSCKISVVYDKTPSTDAGLRTKIADEYGVVSWSWTVDKNAPKGTWPVTVTCAFHKRTAVVVGDLQVVKPGATAAN